MNRSYWRMAPWLVGVTVLGLALPQASEAVAAWGGPATNRVGAGGAAISLRASVGMLNGEAVETVYTRAESGMRKGSELTWDLSGVLIGGLSASAAMGPRVRLNAGVWTGLTEGHGEMTDLDWFVEGLPWTDRSLSNVDVTEVLLLDVNAELLVWSSPRNTLRLMAGYRRDTWKWEDALVSLTYSLDTFRDFTIAGGGINTVNYEQEFRIPYAGVSLASDRGPLRLTAYVRYSPFVSADDKDHHVLRELHFEETFSGGDYYGLGLSATYRHANGFFVGGGLDAQVIPEIRGDLYIVEQDTTIPDSAGIEHNSITFSIHAGRQF